MVQAGSSVGAGGADRPQPPANALSMVLTARSTARCSGHKLLFRGKKKEISFGAIGIELETQLKLINA